MKGKKYPIFKEFIQATVKGKEKINTMLEMRLMGVLVLARLLNI